MKKTIFISVGSLLILTLIGVWIYLFMYGAPKNSADVFSRFGITRTTEISTEPTEDAYVDVTSETAADGLKKLRQLTIRPVAGATFSETSIQYVEQGTGHVYNIDLVTGQETLINGTTIPQTSNAFFSRDGRYVAITSFNSTGESVLVGNTSSELQDTPTVSITLPQGAKEVAFGAATGTINYLIETDIGSSGYQYNYIKETSSRIFSIPLQDVRVLWGKEIYVYTTPTSLQEGYLYKIVADKLTYVAESGYGLMAFLYNDGVVFTRTEKMGWVTTAITKKDLKIDQAVLMISEKCTPELGKMSTVICAIPSNSTQEMFPDSWYKGVISYSDTLWSIDVEAGTSAALSNFKFESGREIDVIQIGTNPEGNRIWFINKNDNTLWMFDTTL